MTGCHAWEIDSARTVRDPVRIAMTLTATRLFGARVRATHDAAKLTESSPEKLRLARTTGRTVLADYEDAPLAIDEVDEGMVVVGGSHALLLRNDGSIVVKPIPEETIAEAKKPAGGGSRKPLPSKNTESGYGFYGTVKALLGGTSKVWEAASQALLERFPKQSPETIRQFLDSKNGRDLADAMRPSGKLDDGYALGNLEESAVEVVKKTAWLDKAMERFAKLPPEVEESLLNEDTGDITFDINISDLVDYDAGGMAPTSAWQPVHSAASHGASYQAARKAALKAFRAALRKDSKFMALAREHGYSLINESQDSDPMKPRLQEEDYADIVVGDDGLLLVVDGETIAVENCDLNSEEDCLRAEGELARQAAALGFTDETDEGVVLEGTFDASYAKGGKVVNGDEEDDWQSGEGYYARRYRRRTSNAETGKPMMPALESIRYGITINVGNEPALMEAMLAKAAHCLKGAAFYVGEHDALGGVCVGFQTAEEAHAFRSLVANPGESPVRTLKLGEGKIPPQFLKKKKKKKGAKSDDDEDADKDADDKASDSDDAEDEPDKKDSDDDEEEQEETLMRVASDFLSENLDPNVEILTIRRYDTLVSEGDYEGALDLAETLAGKLGKLDEYKRRTGSSLSNFRRSLKQQTSQEKVRNRSRRKEYRTNASMRRKKAKYAVRVKRFRRRHESIGESDADASLATRVEAVIKRLRSDAKADDELRDQYNDYAQQLSALAKALRSGKGVAAAADDLEGDTISQLPTALRKTLLAQFPDAHWKGKASADEAMTERKAPLGTGQRFKALKAKLSKRGGVSNPGALAASIGRKKYGAKKFAALAHHGKLGEDVFEDELNQLVATALLNEFVGNSAGDAFYIPDTKLIVGETIRDALVAQEVALGLAEADSGAADDTFKTSQGGGASADTTFAQICAGVFGDIKGEYTGFQGLKERVEQIVGAPVSDPKLMRVMSEFVNCGFIKYTAGKGYILPEDVDTDSLGKLTKAAKIAGNRFVVTIAGGSPVFLPTLEDANKLWKQLPVKLRGIKMPIGGYLESLGIDDSEEAPD